MATYNVTYDKTRLASERERQIVDVLIVTTKNFQVLFAKVSGAAKDNELEEWGARACVKILGHHMPDLKFDVTVAN